MAKILKNKRALLFTCVLDLLFVSCHGNINCKHSSDLTTSEASVIKNYTKYQTFDEFSMKGTGVVSDTPFVYVLDKGNEISVRTSDNVNNEYIYRRLANSNTWKSTVSFDPFGSECFENSDVKENVFHRFFFNDSIVEWQYTKCHSGDGIIANHIFIKTRKEIVLINLDLKNLFPNDGDLYSNVVNIARTYHEMTDLSNVDRYIGFYGGAYINSYMKYKVTNEIDSIHAQFQGVKETCSLTFNGGSIFNMRFGFDKAISKRITPNTKNPRETIDGAYESKFLDATPISSDENVKYTRNGLETHNFKSFSFLKKQFFIFKLKVDEYGNVNDAIVILSDKDKNHDELVKTRCMKLKYKSAGIINSKPVKSWHYVKLYSE